MRTRKNMKKTSKIVNQIGPLQQLDIGQSVIRSLTKKYWLEIITQYSSYMVGTLECSNFKESIFTS